MEITLESASDYSLAIFVGALLALLVTLVLTGRADELRKGIRSLFISDRIPSSAEEFKAASLYDYAAGSNDTPEQDEA